MAADKNSKKAPQAKAISKKSKYVNAQLAAIHCGVTPKTITMTKARHPDMPVKSIRHANDGGWQIDLEALDAWREKTGLLNWETGNSVENARARLAQKDPRHQLQADLLRIQLAEKRGELVPYAEMVKFWSTKFSDFSKQLDRLPDVVGSKARLSAKAIDDLRSSLDEAREALAGGDNEYFFGARNK